MRSSRRRRISWFEALEDRRLLATVAQPVVDIDMNDSRSIRSPGELTNMGDALYLAGSRPTTGEELFLSDSTGTRIIKDILAGTGSSSPRDLVAVGSTLYFTANDGLHGRELWRSDGTAGGTRLVKDIRPGAEGSTPTQLMNFNGTLFFVGEDGKQGVRLWRSDGTAAGTVQVSQHGELPSDVTEVAGQLLFAANDFSGRRALWKSNGTADGTQMIADFNDEATSLHQLTNVGGVLFFEVRAGAQEGLWKSDGTVAGTVYLKDLDIADPGDPETFTSFGGKLYFSLEASGHDELWSSDGTSGGTRLLREFPTLPVEFTPVDDTLFFAQGGSLWKTDGSAAGTQRVAVGLSPRELANFNGQLVFQGRSAAAGTELFVSDGTAGGTVLVRDLNPTARSTPNGYLPNSSTPADFVVSQGQVYFVATDAANGRELWSSDGTQAGTLLRQVDTATAPSTPHTLLDLGGELLFAADGQVWKTSGNGVSEISGLTGISGESARLGNVLLFAATGSEGRELWKAEAGQITLVKDIYPKSPYSPYNYSSAPHDFATVGGLVFFAARTPDEGIELWRSDGTAEGTVLVKDIVPGKVQYLPRSSSPTELVNFNGQLFFTAETPDSGRELWVSDGTDEGTKLLRDLRIGIGGSDPDDLVVVNGKLYFTARNRLGRELWVSDGTPQGTIVVKDIRSGEGNSSPKSLTPVGDQLFFRANDGQTGSELWKTDGTAAGTILVRDINPGSQGSVPSSLVNLDGTLFFSADDGSRGRELWQSDGTSTFQVRDLNPGPASSSPRSLITLGGVLFFAADDRNNGEELFISDGTSPGTRLAANIAQPGGSAPTSLVTSGGTLYFSADDGVVGREVFRITNAAPVISDLGSPIGYVQNAPSVPVAPTANVSDADNTTFGGGRLTVEIVSGGDASNRLEFTGGQFTVNSNTVRRNGVVIGRVNAGGGVGTTSLQITFNGQATTAIVQELLRAIRFRTVQGTSNAPRELAFTLSDGDGGVSDTQTRVVNVISL